MKQVSESGEHRLAEEYIGVLPDMPHIARARRYVLHRMIRHLVADGVTQFLDLGAGIPTVGSVHETAREASPYARVVYVDYRTRQQILDMLAGCELLEPGLTDMIRWRLEPDDGPDPLGGDVTRYSGYAAVGRRP